MKLKFNQHLSAKTSRSVQLKVFPYGKADVFLINRKEIDSAEGTAWICEYNFPDDSVVIARIEFGPAVIEPDAPVDVNVEVHIGYKANHSVIVGAKVEAKKLAERVGISELDKNDYGYSSIQIIQH